MKFLFIVQGEGRGHMTQAIAFSSLLHRQGHELLGVLVGKSERRTIPDFFIREIQAPVSLLESPNFETDGAEKKILLGKTIRKNLTKAPAYWKSLQQIDQTVKSLNPDIILNFYDLLGGLYSFLFRPKAVYWVIGHQYLSAHPEFVFASGRPLERFLFRLNTQVTALGAVEVLALSFLPKSPSKKLKVMPPLLRQEIKTLPIKKADFYLTYMVNPGYGEEVKAFAAKIPHLQIKAYWDKKDAEDIEHPLPNLSFHRVNDRSFLEDMAACKGLVCTAGFESVCEAMYLRKPVMMIPVAGQYEQACNALDAVASGAGIASENFDFSQLEWVEKKDSEASLFYQEWVDSWPELFRKLMAQAEEKQPNVQYPEKLNQYPSFG